MELTIEQALRQGVAAHKEGKLQDAERLYRAILQYQPTHPDVNHNLGALAVSVNKADAALPLFKTALEANPKIEQFWLSYIDALIKEKQFDNAKEVLAQAKKQGVAVEKLSNLKAQVVFKNETENVSSASPSNKQINNLLQDYQNGRFGEAEKLPFDKEGRIILPKNLIDHSGIKNQALFVGLGPTFQIWEPTIFNMQKIQTIKIAKRKKLNPRLKPIPKGI